MTTPRPCAMMAMKVAELKEELEKAKKKLDELKHMLHFFLAQLRWEHKKCISPTQSFREFDAFVASIECNLACQSRFSESSRGRPSGTVRQGLEVHHTTCKYRCLLLESQFTRV